jgi:hypothetical protein
VIKIFLRPFFAPSLTGGKAGRTKPIRGYEVREHAKDNSESYIFFAKKVERPYVAKMMHLNRTSEMNTHLFDILRPIGPADNSPERQLGVEWSLEMRPQGPAQSIKCRTFGAHKARSYSPGLTAGPIICRPFGPRL